MYEFDFKKHGLKHLERIPIEKWSSDDVEKWISAFKADNIAPRLPFPYSQGPKLRALSYCRKCGECCQPRDEDPEDPGIEVNKNQIRTIAGQTHISYKSLKKKINVYENGWYLPLPCPFHKKKEGCTIYQVRPVICRVYPVRPAVFGEQVTCCIDLKCEYGEEIYRSAFDIWRKTGNTLLP